MTIEYTGERVVPCKTPYVMVQEHIGRYVFASDFVRDKDVVLDIACGTGYGTSYLSKLASEVVGGDIDAQVVRYAEKNYGNSKTTFVQCNCTSLPFPDSSFDVVISIETIEHLVDYESFLKECSRVLKKDGIFICTTPNARIFHPWGLGNKGPHVKEFTPREITELCSKYWSDTELYGQCYVRFGEPTLRLAKKLLWVWYPAIAPLVQKIRYSFNPHYQKNRGGLPEFAEISNAMLDQSYKFSPMKSGKPKFLGVVAREKT